MRLTTLCALCCLFVSVGCGKDGNEIPCSDTELWDHVREVCVPDRPIATDDTGVPNDSSTPDGDDDASTSDSSTEPDTSEPIDPNCDKDRDGYISVECGGDDCDDNNAGIHPDATEICDEIDNNCNGNINEGLNCSFYAHTGSVLYLIDPFQKTLLEVNDDLPNLQDIDTHPSGPLLGVSRAGLFQYDDLRGYWFQVGDFGRNGPDDPNGLAVDLGGRVFVTAADDLWEVDITDGAPTLIGDLGVSTSGEEFYSSGDCVVNKSDTLYVTSKHDPTNDWLLLVDRNTGAATEVGAIGFEDVFALTAAWGKLYGLTKNGEMIEINSTTGEGTLLHTFPGVSFYGAASTPGR